MIPLTGLGDSLRDFVMVPNSLGFNGRKRAVALDPIITPSRLPPFPFSTRPSHQPTTRMLHEATGPANNPSSCSAVSDSV